MDQIQALIAEIDEALTKSRQSRLGWLKLGNNNQQRQFLERVRTNLQSIEQNLASTKQAQSPTGESKSMPSVSGDLLESLASEKMPQEILQAVVQEMSYLRTFYQQSALANLRQQYQADLEGLQRQRQALIEEIQRLEEYRHNYDLLLQSQQKQSGAESRSFEGSNSQTRASILPSQETPQAPPQAAPAANGEIVPAAAKLNNPEEALPYAGVELRSPYQPQQEVLPDRKAELAQNAADLAENLGPAAAAASNFQALDINQMNPPACKIEDAPNFVPPNYLHDLNLTRQSESVETISALTDLIETVPTSEAVLLADESAIALPDSPLDESLPVPTNLIVTVNPDEQASAALGTFTPASAEEDLLPTSHKEKSNIDLWLGKNMIDRLSEDLSSLEGNHHSPEVHTEVENLPKNNDLEAEQTEPKQASSQREYIAENNDLTPAASGLEEIPCTIPEDILAEFDDLFGDAPEKTAPVGLSDAEANISQGNIVNETSQMEKKN